MRKSLIVLCILVMAFSLFGTSAQEDFSKIGLRNRAAGLQAVYNHLQSQGQTGLIKGWWRFEVASGNLPDELGINNLTKNGNPTYQQIGPYGITDSIGFNGTDAFFSITDALQTGLDFNGAELLTDGGLEVWTGDDLDYWSEGELGSSTITDETVKIHSGSHSAKITIDATGGAGHTAEFYQDNALGAFTQYAVEIWHKGDSYRYYLKNMSNGKYLQSDGSWSTSYSVFTIVAQASYTKTVKIFISDTAANYRLDIFNSIANEVTYIDDISITECQDALILAVVKSSDKSAPQSIIQKYDSERYLFRLEETTGYMRTYLTDGTNTQSVYGTTDVCDGDFHLLQYTFDRDLATGLKVHLDGSLDCTPTDPTSVGVLKNTATFYLGSTSGSSEFFKGSIAELMVITGAPLIADILGDDFALFAYNQALGYPLNLPKKIN